MVQEVKTLKVNGVQPNSRMCFVCGMENRFGLKARFFELEDASLMAVFSGLDEHQSYPGRLHGGMIATILDETIGRAVMYGNSEIWGVTVDFSMKFRKPVPLEEEIKVLARIESETKRSFKGEGWILLADGTVAAEARGKYLKMDIEKIADFDHKGDEWFTFKTPDDPEEFTIPVLY